jgi:hypothetical protein
MPQGSFEPSNFFDKPLFHTFKLTCAKGGYFFHLKSVEASGLGYLDLLGEPFDQVFVDDAIRGGEEGLNAKLSRLKYADGCAKSLASFSDLGLYFQVRLTPTFEVILSYKVKLSV